MQLNVGITSTRRKLEQIEVLLAETLARYEGNRRTAINRGDEEKAQIVPLQVELRAACDTAERALRLAMELATLFGVRNTQEVAETTNRAYPRDVEDKRL